ncbi:MAG TPA: PEP-CTERM sorting domain-containing protein [Candidatus Sulfopaludibacter sp.]|nr:PEP-CTERM sorting domain-containing protein [Candidatus Sulfopaludibacter sp.]
MVIACRFYKGAVLPLWSLFIGVSLAGAGTIKPAVFAHADAEADSFTCNCVSGGSQGDLSFTTGIRQASATGAVLGADASSSATAGFGALHASADAGASTAALESVGSAEAKAGWVDLFTITSKTLGFGAPVDFRATAVLEGTVSSAPAGKGQTSSAAAVFELTFGGISVGFGCPDAISLCGANAVTNFAESVNDKFSGSKLPSTKTFDLPTFVGDQLFFEGVLAVNAAAVTAGKAAADFSDTGFVTFESLTPDASFTTASGATYAPVSTVPEPSTIGLVSVGLAIAFPLFRRRRLH